MAADLEELARTFFGGYAEGDLDKARSLLADDAVTYITNPRRLARVADGHVAELWMVDAKPAYSDEFWS